MTYVEIVDKWNNVMATFVFGGRTQEEVFDEVTAKLTGTYELRVKQAHLVLPDNHLRSYRYDSTTDELTELEI